MFYTEVIENLYSILNLLKFCILQYSVEYKYTEVTETLYSTLFYTEVTGNMYSILSYTEIKV